MSVQPYREYARTKWYDFIYFRMWREIWPYAAAEQRKTIILYHVMYTIGIGISLTIPYWMGQLVNSLQAGGDDLLANAGKYLGLILFCQLCFWTIHGPGRIMERKTGQIISVAFTNKMFEKLSALPLSWHQDHHSGNTINRIRTASGAIKYFVENSYASFQGVASLVGALAMLVWFSPIVGVTSLCCFMLAMSLIIALNKRITAAVHDSNEAMHQASATFYDFVSNMVSIIVLRLQKFSAASLARRFDASMPPFMREVRVNELRYFIYAMLNVTMLAIVLLGYIKFNLDAGVTVATGALVTVYLYQDRIGNQGYAFLWVHSQWLNGLTSIEATNQLVSDYARFSGEEVKADTAGWNLVALKNVDFAYKSEDGSLRSTLKGLDLDMRRGEKIALIGGSGAGKSTLLSLLRALHTPQSADLSIDGRVGQFSDLADLTTLIPQDPEIFENTIRFNVSFGLDTPDENVNRALVLAEFDKVLADMPQGLDTDIREKGVNLSVGQKQRLALARGIFAAEQSDIILLDEPTSSVDLPTEERIFRNLFARFHDKTIVATLHRLHLLPMFDRIIYLENGRILSDMKVADALSTEGPIRHLFETYQRKAA